MTDNSDLLQQFLTHAVTVFQSDPTVIGLAAGGLWATAEMADHFEIDLIVITQIKIATEAKKIAYAHRLGDLLSAFTGEHVGEPDLLICLYNDSLLYVGLQFMTINEVAGSTDEPIVILLDNDQRLYRAMYPTSAVSTFPDFQWIEDRIWVWLHHLLLKVKKEKYNEALDLLTYLKKTIFGPLINILDGGLPKGARRVETGQSAGNSDFIKLERAGNDRASLIAAAESGVLLYQQLRRCLFGKTVVLKNQAEEEVVQFLNRLKRIER